MTELPLSPGVLFLPGLLQPRRMGGVGLRKPSAQCWGPTPASPPVPAPGPHPSPAGVRLLPLFSSRPEALSSRYFAALSGPASWFPGSGGPKGWQLGMGVPPEHSSSEVLCWWGREPQLITECGWEVLPFCALATFPRAGMTGPFCQGDAPSPRGETPSQRGRTPRLRVFCLPRERVSPAQRWRPDTIK